MGKTSAWDVSSGLRLSQLRCVRREAEPYRFVSAIVYIPVTLLNSDYLRAVNLAVGCGSTKSI